MRRLLLSLFIVTSACGSLSRSPSSVEDEAPAPAGALTLEEALRFGPQTTFESLKSQMKSEPLQCPSKDYGACLPKSLRGSGKADKQNSDRDPKIQGFLREYRKKSFEKKQARALELIGAFKCDDASEAFALGLSLERDFPEAAALSSSLTLLEKVGGCPVAYARESWIRLGVLQMGRENCGKALESFDRATRIATEPAPQDRLNYLKEKCQPGKSKPSGTTPWGAYTLLFASGEASKTSSEKKRWYLTAQSGSEDWDRSLALMVRLLEAKNERGFRAFVEHLDLEGMRTLPRSFQASVLSLLHFASVDLLVFQHLHRMSTTSPAWASTELQGLLFPRRYWDTIAGVTEGIDPVLVKSLIRQESAFNPSARSRARALGLMQLILPTARRYGVRSPQELLKPERNIRAGALFLKDLIEQFGSIELALAAYNAGPDAVKDWQKRYPTKDPDLFVELIPYKETREYVRLVLRNYRVYRALLSESHPTLRLARSSAD
jgi:soluble lytic murein transglycosylase